jgi:UDP-N-acetylmuramate dehydrogenase
MKALISQQITTLRSAFPEITEYEPMAKHTSFRVGGSSRLYAVLGDPERIIALVTAAEQASVPWFVYGGGSNLLVADEGYEGLVIQMANRGIKIEGTRVYAESGLITGLLARKTVEAGLTGFEWAIGVPGTVGGAIYGDAGCYGGEMRDSVASVDAYSLASKQRVRLDRAACEFGYRESIFKRERHLIFSCELELKLSPDPVKSREQMESIMRERKEKQPLDQSSAGCAFKNFEYTQDTDIELLARQVEVPPGMRTRKSLGAGWLVDQAGLLGTRVGDVEISQKHGNFMINRGQARAQDVISLISLVKRKVRDDFGIELHEEVQLLGFE